MKHEISAGAVVYAYKHTTCYYLLLLYESGYWGFVKGKSESGETLEQTAVREIAEETGIEIIPYILCDRFISVCGEVINIDVRLSRGYG